jgi:hypothetical protein
MTEVFAGAISGAGYAQDLSSVFSSWKKSSGHMPLSFLGTVEFVTEACSRGKEFLPAAHLPRAKSLFENSL